MWGWGESGIFQRDPGAMFSAIERETAGPGRGKKKNAAGVRARIRRTGSDEHSAVAAVAADKRRGSVRARADRSDHGARRVDRTNAILRFGLQEPDAFERYRAAGTVR